MSRARAFVVEAEIALSDLCDPAAAGAAVTAELCGHWKHDGACRWPHNNSIDPRHQPARFRTLFVANESEEPGVRERIETGLRRGKGWRVLSVRSRPLAERERALADTLIAGPRRSSKT